jgi:hypothetical protein
MKEYYINIFYSAHRLTCCAKMLTLKVLLIFLVVSILVDATFRENLYIKSHTWEERKSTICDKKI